MPDPAGSRVFCYPDGNMDTRVRREVERAGYTCTVTVEHGFARRGADPLALPRVHTEADYTHFLQSTSGFEAFNNRLRGTATEDPSVQLASMAQFIAVSRPRLIQDHRGALVATRYVIR